MGTGQKPCGRVGVTPYEMKALAYLFLDSAFKSHAPVTWTVTPTCPQGRARGDLICESMHVRDVHVVTYKPEIRNQAGC